jgi:hemin uptake protein HemP
MTAPAPSTPSPPPVAEPSSVRRVDSQALLGKAQQIEIVHGSQVYRLRLTSLGKLILTK